MLPTTAFPLAGRYRLDARIAAGGVGEVWRAADLVLDRPVAVKLLRAEYAEHPGTLARFRAEARHAGSLSHPGIARVYDYGEADPPYLPYLVMELVDGQSLDKVLAGGPLDPVRAMDVVAQTAAGLQAAHGAGLVHRDIKPANLLVGPGGQVKITDFGIAHAAGSAPVTRIGTLVGTPAYLAPERAAGAQATPASDLYALGVVAYECLAGWPPFSGTPLEVAASHRQRQLPALPPTVPAEVADLVAHLTAKNPAARPAAAGDVALRAAHLRDVLASGAAGQMGTGPDPSSATLLTAPLAMLTDAEVPGSRAAPRRRPGVRVWSGRAVVLAIAAAAVTAGVAGWLLAGLLAAAHPARQPAVARSAATVPRGSAKGLVTVNADALVGQRVDTVRLRLRQLGLQVHVLWHSSGDQPPGTVLSVQPSGQVRSGSTVTLVAALAPPGHRHGEGNGHGGGGGGGGD